MDWRLTDLYAIVAWLLAFVGLVLLVLAFLDQANPELVSSPFQGAFVMGLAYAAVRVAESYVTRTEAALEQS